MPTAPALVARPSGILVPVAAMERTTHTLPESDFMKLRRLMKFAREFGMIAMFHCEQCKGPVQLSHRDQIVETLDGKPDGTPAGGGRILLSCGCATWTVR